MKLDPAHTGIYLNEMKRLCNNTILVPSHIYGQIKDLRTNKMAGLQHSQTLLRLLFFRWPKLVSEKGPHLPHRARVETSTTSILNYSHFCIFRTIVFAIYLDAYSTNFVSRKVKMIYDL